MSSASAVTSRDTVGGDRAEQASLGPDHRQICDTVPTQRDGEIGDDLALIMPGPNRPPRRERLRQQPGEAGDPATSPSNTPPAEDTNASRPGSSTDSESSYASPTECLPLKILDGFPTPRIPSRTGTSVLYAPNTPSPDEITRLVARSRDMSTFAVDGGEGFLSWFGPKERVCGGSSYDELP